MLFHSLFIPCNVLTLFIDLAYIRAMPGLSAGRNAAVRATITPYVMLLDDDYIFTERTNILKLLQVWLCSY